MKSFLSLRPLAFVVTLHFMQLDANGATITFSGTITGRQFGSLYNIGEAIEITLTTSTSIGLPNALNTAGASIWQGDLDRNQQLSTIPSASIWESVAVTGTTLNPLDTSLPGGLSGEYFSINRLSGQLNAREVVLHPTTYERQGLGLLRGGQELNYIFADVFLGLEIFPIWQGESSGTIEEVLPSITHYGNQLGSMDVITLGFSDGSLYRIGGSADRIFVTTTIPEPSSVLLIFGAASMMLLRRRCK
jgi:hypothetical protein